MIKKTTDMKNHAVRSPFVMGVGPGGKSGASKHPESAHDGLARVRLAGRLAEAARVHRE